MGWLGTHISGAVAGLFASIVAAVREGKHLFDKIHIAYDDQ